MTRTSAATLPLAVSLLMIVSGCAEQATVGPATTGPPTEAATAPAQPSPTTPPTATETALPVPTQTVPPPPTAAPTGSICSPGVANSGEGGQP